MNEIHFQHGCDSFTHDGDLILAVAGGTLPDKNTVEFLWWNTENRNWMVRKYISLKMTLSLLLNHLCSYALVYSFRG